MASRAAHRRLTLLGLGEAAISLFESDGPSVTIEAIAESAGMSRRTITRYVNAKEELAFVHPLLWWDVFSAALTDNDELAPIARLQAGSVAIASHIDDDPEPPRRAFRVAATHPELLSGFNGVFRLWVDQLTSVIEPMLDDRTPDAQRIESRVLASAIMGMVDAITREWVFDADTTYTTLSTRGFALIHPILDQSLNGSPSH